MEDLIEKRKVKTAAKFRTKKKSIYSTGFDF